MKTLLIVAGAALLIGAAAIPGIMGVVETAPPKFAKDAIAVVGEFTYSISGCENKLTPEESANVAEYYTNFFTTPLINNGGVKIRASGESLESVLSAARWNNELNQGRGAAVKKTREDGTTFIDYEKSNTTVRVPDYVITGSIKIVCCDKKGNKQSITFEVIITDTRTGEVVGRVETSGSGERMQNYKELGPKPSVWERFFSGYVREITYDDLLKDMLQQSAIDAAKKLLEIDPLVSNGRKLVELPAGKAKKDEVDCDPTRSVKKDAPPKPSDKVVLPPPKEPIQDIKPPKDTSLESYCPRFSDAWFPVMSYVNGFCYPGTWGSLPVNTPEAVFNSALSIGLIGEDEFATSLDEQFRTDFSGRKIPFGANRDVGDTHEQFESAPFGSFATRKSLNTWQVVFDNKGAELGHRQEVSITYIVRQGRCYATLGVDGQGPLNSQSYYGPVASKASEEATRVTATMKGIELCGM